MRTKIEEPARRSKLLQALNIIFIFLTIGLNGLANALPLNGQTTGDISDRFEVFFVPAGYVFSIWGLIYLALIGFVVFQALPSQQTNRRLANLGSWVIATCLYNMGWLLAWHYEWFGLSVLMMLSLLGSLIVSYVRVYGSGRPDSLVEQLAIGFPFSLYLGWISVATVANISSYLDFLGWQGQPLTPQLWTVLMLLVGVLLTTVFVIRFSDNVYAAVFVWAYIGIFIRFQDVPIVATGSLFATILVIILAVSAAWRRFKLASQGDSSPVSNSMLQSGD